MTRPAACTRCRRRRPCDISRSLGHKRTQRHHAAMSALVPKADSCSAAKAVWLFDDLVGEQLDRIWHLDTEQPGGLHVDDELESRGLIDRQLGGLLALENPRDVESSAAIAVWNVVAIAHQPARRDIYAVGVHRRDGVTCRQRD